LQELIANLDEGVAWQSWKDHARRTLLQCAAQVRSAKTQAYLEPLLRPPAQAEEPAKVPSIFQLAKRASGIMGTGLLPAHDLSPLGRQRLGSDLSVGTVSNNGSPDAQADCPSSPSDASPTSRPLDQPVARNLLLLPTGEDSVASPENTPEVPSPGPLQSLPMVENEEALRLAAYRAVVKDDTTTLADMMQSVPMEVWRSWTNKGGKGLVELAEERRSVASYSMLGKALGILQERKRESFEEQEAVWVMEPGDVQPKQATVLEDTPESADLILLKFWTGNDDDPPTKVDRDCVLKANL